MTTTPKETSIEMIDKYKNILNYDNSIDRAIVNVNVYLSYKFNIEYWQKVKEELLKVKIERFYNKSRESDVKYCKFENISPKLVETIKNILGL